MKNLQKTRSKNNLIFLFTVFFLVLFCRSGLAEINKTEPVPVEFNTDFNFPFQTCWSYLTEKSISSLNASDNGNELYGAFYYDELISLNFSGNVYWKTELGGQHISNLLIKDKNIILATRAIDNNSIDNNSVEITKNNIRQSATIRSIDRFTGITNWSVNISDSERIYLYEFDNNIILISQEGEIRSILMSSGRSVWEGILDAQLSSIPFLDKEDALIGTADGYIVQWSLGDGKQIGKLKVSTAPTAVTKKSSDRKLFWGDGKGSVFSVKYTGSDKLSQSYKNIWQFRNGAKISHLISTPKGLLVASFDNFLYLISHKDGEIIWKKRFSGRIYSEPLVIDGHVVVITTAESVASIVEINSGKLVNSIALKNDNTFTGNPVKAGNQLIFPTLNGIFSFSSGVCSKIKKEGVF